MFVIYGKRNGLPDKNGKPVFDKIFRALDYDGVRVNSLEDAGTYAEKSDAEEIVTAQQNDLVIFEIRKVKE